MGDFIKKKIYDYIHEQHEKSVVEECKEHNHEMCASARYHNACRGNCSCRPWCDK